MKRWLIAMLMVFPVLAVASTRDAENYFFDTKLGNFQDDLADAKKQGKQGILLFFEMDDCPFCARMKATIMNQSEVQDFYHQHFLLFPIDTNGDVSMTDFKGHETKEKDYALENRVRATPTMLFYDLDGNLVVRYTGPTKDANEFLMLARYVIEGAYKEMPFTRYKQKQGTH